MQLMDAMASDQPSRPSISQPIPSRAPLPLSASQEQQVRDIYHKRVRAKCADEIKEFAMCARQHSFLATFSCKEAQRIMNSCMMRYATLEEQDRAREEWFATRDQRRKERELKEEKRKEAERIHRQWWGLDEHGRRIVKPESNTGSENDLAKMEELAKAVIEQKKDEKKR
ncbi:uncharacterized protein PV09_06349 [Verruconis gallopava]|uniref:COX assembly mitochondrial protein n=1 Tax=Verruconis gallopava TaxID=253628 RepID=A0A0D1YN64_9PEZI|nr:uncharacterized protein PV09_06349 [Verruconis gallopava]KIW02192.1 hypothetical protein PV09_06349 [Verruconis gallopava]